MGQLETTEVIAVAAFCSEDLGKGCKMHFTHVIKSIEASVL